MTHTIAPAINPRLTIELIDSIRSAADVPLTRGDVQALILMARNDASRPLVVHLIATLAGETTVTRPSVHGRAALDVIEVANRASIEVVRSVIL